jgi:hypothetical protein
MALSTSSLPTVDPVLLHVVLPIPIGLLASRLFYGWVSKAGLQSEGFSPTVATILTTPLLAVAYFILATMVYTGGHDPFLLIFLFLVLFAPIVIPLSPLLTIYLRGGLQGKGVILSATSVAFVALQFVGLWFLSGLNIE